MSGAMAAAHPPHLDTVLSFSRGADRPASDEADAVASSSYDSDDSSDAGFEFAFAPPLVPEPADGSSFAPADHLFAHGRILPAYPVFDRHLLLDSREDGPAAPPAQQAASTSTAPPSPDTYCAWAPRSAPGSPARERPAAPGAPFPKSASTGDARRFWRLPHLGGGGRSRSDGRDKFVFLQQQEGKRATTTKPSAAPAPQQTQKQKQKQKQGKKKGAATEMDMATAHRLFYGKQGAGALPGDRRQPPQQQHSYLPYRTGIVGFFASAHAVGRSHHPY